MFGPACQGEEIRGVKVLQLISSGGYYGAENMLLNLVGGDESTISQNVLAVFHNRHRPNIDLYERAMQRGVRAELVGCRGRFDWEGVRSVRRLVRSNGIDVIHTHGYKADLYGHAAARLEGKPVVATCHNWLAGGPVLGAYNFLDRIALRHFDAVSAVSQSVADKLVSFGVRRERISVIPNGVDLRGFDAGLRAAERPPQPRKEQVIGIVARLDLQKGFEYLLGALRRLRDTFPGLRLLAVGEGPDRAAIEALVTEHGLNDVVTLAGQQSDMPAMYASMDLFVLPSLNEGLPMTLLEAMAASRPVIATRVGAVPTVIRNGETGLLIEPADEAELMGAIGALLRDPELCQRLAQGARAHVAQNYTAAAMIQKYRELYQVVVKRRAGRAVKRISALAVAGGPNSGCTPSPAGSVTTDPPKQGTH
jgi:glycosyltransferase involved in cell wall biosynthesis